MMLCLYARDELVRNSWVIKCFCRKDLALIPRVTPNWVFCLVVAVWTEICVALVLQNGMWRTRRWFLLNDWISFISPFFQKYFPLIFFFVLVFLQLAKANNRMQTKLIYQVTCFDCNLHRLTREWPRRNFSLLYIYNIMQTSDEIKEKCQSWDY